VNFGKGPMKFVTLPMGPIIDAGYESICTTLLSEALAYCKSINAFLFQLKIPFAKGISDAAVLSTISIPRNSAHRFGFPLDVMAVPNHMLWIDYQKLPSDDEEWESQMLRSFSSSRRRNIRIAIDNGLSVHQPTTEAELKEAYALVELNGQEQGYSTRNWQEFGPTLIEQVKRGQARVLTASYGKTLLGTHYGVLAGRRWSYLMGGTVRTEKDYKAGAFLHWQAMKAAHALGLRGYDLTSWGSPGVAEFKKGFRPTPIEFDTPHHFVLAPLRFFAFMKAYPLLRKHKSIVTRYAKRLLTK
jgi:lipid II:glycine glycyltransferase (peptidoglycan interpeptide bridge formation enzyme)